MTGWVQDRANELLRKRNAGVKYVPYAKAITAASTHQEDFVLPYVKDLQNVVDLEAIRSAGLKLAVDPLGGAALYAESLKDQAHLQAIVNAEKQPTDLRRSPRDLGDGTPGHSNWNLSIIAGPRTSSDLSDEAC